MHRTCPLLGLLGRRRVRAEKARERPVVGGPPRGAPHLPASWPSWPPASTGREGARTARCRRGPQGCTALARFLAFLAAGEYGPRRRENGPLSAGPPGVHRTCPLLGLLGRRRVRGEKARERPVVGGPPRGAPHLPASWPSWPPASTGREGARTARCRRGPQGCTALARFLAFLAAGEYGPRRRENGPLSAGPPGVHRTCPLLGLLGRRRVRGEKARERPVVGGAPRGAPHLPASWPSWPPASIGRKCKVTPPPPPLLLGLSWTRPRKPSNTQERCKVEAGGGHQKWQGLSHDFLALLGHAGRSTRTKKSRRDTGTRLVGGPPPGVHRTCRAAGPSWPAQRHGVRRR